MCTSSCSIWHLSADVYQAEEERLNELNRILREVFDNRVVLIPQWPPPGVEEPQVLECGVGKGAWVEDLLGEYEDCVVSDIKTTVKHWSFSSNPSADRPHGGDWH